MSEAPLHNAAAIARLLAGRIDELVRELLPGGRREGCEWRAGSVAGEAGQSLGVRLVGAKAGVWADFAVDDGMSGDALDLVCRTLGLNIADAISWSRRWLGIDDVLPPHRIKARPRAGTGADAIDRQERALEIWRDATEDISGTPAELYLRSRGLDPARLVSLHGPDRWPATLRYAEQAAMAPERECRALIVAVHSGGNGLVSAIHRVLLQPDGSAVRDERGRRRKLSLGPISGNAAMGDYWPDVQGRWGLTEGPENALAAYALSGIPTWAAIGASNLPHVAPPAWARHVTIFADHDPAGLAAAAETRSRLLAHRSIETVRIVGAPVHGSDAADLLGGR